MTRIYLSPPDLAGGELDMLGDALRSGWVAPIGPHVDAFEDEVSQLLGIPHALATSSGTAALHLAMLAIGVGPGDEVWTQALTFAATANAIAYCGATPVFLDSERTSWNLDPDLLSEALDDAARANRLPKAVIAVDLYGQCADYDKILAACRRHGVILVEDAAEALGATYRGRPAGSFGDLAILSFNGNKIITTSGGGMLLGHDRKLLDRARHLSAQAREPVVHYEHKDIGFNYRLSNLLAAVGRVQLADLSRRVTKRRALNAHYRSVLGALPGWSFMPEMASSMSTFWLSCATVHPISGVTRDELVDELQAEDIEARPVWKPLHLQPVFRAHRVIGGTVSEELFAHGLCLPSGSSLTPRDVERITSTILRCYDASTNLADAC